MFIVFVIIVKSFPFRPLRSHSIEIYEYLARANSFIVKSTVKKIKTFNPQPYVRWLFLLQVVYCPNDANYNRR